MTEILTPHNIEFLLWCHTRLDRFPTLESLAAQEILREFIALGVIGSGGYKNVWVTTPKGKAWVDALCNVPPPRQVYVDEMGRVLNSQ